MTSFQGAVTVGSRVSKTIKNGIVPGSIFFDKHEGDAGKGTPNPGLQLLGFVNAIFISSGELIQSFGSLANSLLISFLLFTVWLSIATRLGWPVSTTYSIVSAVAGIGIAAGGWDAVNWGWNGGSGLGAVFAGLGIAPAMAAGFGAVVYLMVKYVVLKRENPTKWGLYTGPFWFFVVAAVCTMSIVYKGSPELGLDKMSPSKTAAAIIITAVVVSILSMVFWWPFVYAKVVKKDYTLRFYHFFLGPLLWKRPAPEDAGIKEAVSDYRLRAENELDGADQYDRAEGNQSQHSSTLGVSPELEKAGGEAGPNELRADDKAKAIYPTDDVEERDTPPNESNLERDFEKGPQIEGPWILPQNLWIILRYKAGPFVYKIFTHGASVDIHALQAQSGNEKQGKRMQEIYARAKQYPNDTEHLFSFMQVVTACTASFAHGANDLSNAIGPFSVIYDVWKKGTISGADGGKTKIEVWMLVYGAATLVVGLATYGYNIMAVLGNRITLHSPSRGFCMELGASITVILASQYGIPVSTTMCITGATIGVALCNGDIRTINWRQIAWIYLGWFATIIIVCTASACLLAIVINAPRKHNHTVN